MFRRCMTPLILMMNTSVHYSSHTAKENIPPSSKHDASQVQRAKQRTVLGVLSENEQRSFSQGSQFSKHSTVSDCSQLTFLGCLSSSNYDVYVEEAREVVLADSGHEELPDSCYLDPEAAALQNDDLRLLLDLTSDASAQFEPDKLLVSEVVLCLSEYAEDIYRNLREGEMKFRPKPDYLRKHPEITSGMRLILVDWLVEVMQEYKLCSETLHLAVNYLDRFLSCTASVTRGKLQLVGTAALLVAAKYEEVSPPELTEFVSITDNTYTNKQLVRMEHFLLRVLGFKMAAPTANQFLRLFMSIHSVCAYTQNLALYVTELSLLEMDPFLQYAPSKVAAGAYCLASYTVNKSLWPDSLHVFTGYTMDEIVPCLVELHKLHVAAESQPEQAVREKYKSSKYYGVSWMTPPPALPFL